MAETILIIGGSRSGKSDYAQSLAEQGSAERYYLATCPRPSEGSDPEMTTRILAHQKLREGCRWQTIEEPLHLAGLLKTLPTQATILIDCLTLWISNLLLADESATLDEARITILAEELLAACRSRQGQVVIVSSEVGCGTVPEHALTRRYRDLAGRCNQVMAAGADRLTQVVCGIPIKIKG